MADVFLALAPAEGGRPRKQVVIKQLLRDIVEDDEFRAMLLDEGRLATRLTHPNLVSTFAVDEAEGERFLVMEFLDGQPLSRIRSRAKGHGGVPMVVHLRVISDVLRGVHYLHELRDENGQSLGVVHRDVTPQNVFVTYDGHVKLVDFGIAKVAARLAHTQMGVVKGKLAYLSPESVRGEPVDRRSDVFSIGVMLWEAAVGVRFWQDFDELTVYRRLIAGDLPLGGPLEKDIDPRLLRIIGKAVAVRPEDRFATASQMHAELEYLLMSFPKAEPRRLVREHVRTLFADDREVFNEFVHEELVRLDAGRGALAPLPRRARRLDQLPVDGAPVSSKSSATLRTDMTSGDDILERSTPPRAGRARRAALAFTTAAVLGATVLASLALHQQVRSRRPAVAAASGSEAAALLTAVSAAPKVESAPAKNPIAAPRADAGAAPMRAQAATSSANAAADRARDEAPVDAGAAQQTHGDSGASAVANPIAQTPTPVPGPASVAPANNVARWTPRRPSPQPSYAALPNGVRARRSLDREDPWNE